MLYGRPTKHIRIANEVTLTLGPQRFQTHTIWKYGDTGTARTDGLDINQQKVIPLGSIIKRHKQEILITPETIEPQQIYMGRIKLSFSDVMNHAISGGRFEQASYGDTATENFSAKSNPIGPHFYPDISATDGVTNVNTPSADTDQEIGGSGSGYGIQEWKLDDHIHHWISLKKLTVFDQRPVMGERWQRIPSKVKRINEGTFYGLFFFNDSPRGATPADTQVKINIKDYIEELAI